MNVTGTIKEIKKTQIIGSSNFKKRDVIITTDELYPQHILIQFVQDKCDILDKYKVGQLVEVGINLRGREWINPQGETVYFNTIQGWKISENNTQNNNVPIAPEQQDNYESVETFDEEEMDLPF